MDATEEETQELNFMFKSIGQQWKQAHQVWKENNAVSTQVLDQLSEVLSKDTPENQIVLRPYGSAAEDLKCLELEDIGDVDIMIFPTSDDFIISEDLLEYSPVNPLHVRIKGSDHPVLQSCLVEGTEYVATSAIKKFHPQIYGNVLPGYVDLMTRVFHAMPRGKLSPIPEVTTHLKNKAASPAVTFNFSQRFGAISNELGRFKNQGNASHKVCLETAEWDWLGHLICISRGIKYTRKHAEFLSDFLQFICEKAQQINDLTCPVVFQELCSSNRAEQLKTRLREIEGPSLIDEKVVGIFRETPGVKSSGKQFVTPEYSINKDACGEKNGNSNDMLRNYDEGQPSIEDYPSTSSHSTQGKLKYVPVQVTERIGVGDMTKEQNENRNGCKTHPKSEEKPLAPKKEQTSKGSPANLEYQSTDPLQKVRNRWLQHLLLTETSDATGTAPHKTESSDGTEKTMFHQQASGIDFVPALRSRGWPKVAHDWLKRERKWPSPKMANKVIQEGFHLVVKPPKNNGKADCDFRISFSHAEYLVSQEMNDIQRESYRCLKKFHRAHLSKPAGLESFHLKNLLLQTIEETGAEMWTESKRAECMMKLLGNLLKALKEKDLRHFFVRSYNLFGVDYIENPEILESLAEVVEKIMENPKEFSNELIDSGKEKEDQLKKECASLKENILHSEITKERQHSDAAKRPTKGNDDSKRTEATRCPNASYRYHDLKDNYLKISNEMINIAFNEIDCSLETLDPLERSIVEGLREIGNDPNIHVEDLPEIFDFFWNLTYYKVWISSEPDMRRRMLDAIHGDVEMWRYTMKQKDIQPGNEEALLVRMLDPSADNSFDLNSILPAGTVTQCFRRIFSSFQPMSQRPVNMDDLPLD